MAELLSVFASGMSVVSLAIQVAESIQKLKAFHSLIRNAPIEIAFLLDEIEGLSLLLEDIDGSIQRNVVLDQRTKLAVMKSYRLCLGTGDILKSLARDLAEGIEKGRKRGGFKAALNKGKIEDIQKRLESSKATLLLANQCYNNAVQRQNWESHERDILEIKAAVGQLSAMNMMIISPENPTVKESEDTGDGAIEERIGDLPNDMSFPRVTRCSLRHTRGFITRRDGVKSFGGLLNVVMSNRGLTTSTSISVSFPSWIHARRYQLCLTKSVQGWDQSLRSYRVVSFDAPVFQYCKGGNVAGLQVLFETGQASPFEADPEGRTPLHYAALYARPDVCHFLLDHGADASVPTSWHGGFERRGISYEMAILKHYSKSYIKTQQPYRGQAAYSTPLNLLVMDGMHLVREGRRSFDARCVESNRPIKDDYYDTIEALMTRGDVDILDKDQFGFTILHAYTGPWSIFSRLKRQEELQISNMEFDELQKLLCGLTITHLGCAVPMLYEILPTGKITKSIAQNFPQTTETWDCPSLLFLTSLYWSWNYGINIANWTEIDNLAVELVESGSELHVIEKRRSRTMLLEMISYFLVYTRATVRSRVRSWLGLLSRAGVDLRRFGRTENILHETNQVSWSFYRNIELPTFQPKNHCRFSILEIRIGSTPQEFHIELEDLYVSAGLLEGFWKWVEGTAVFDNRESQVMPGAWSDD